MDPVDWLLHQARRYPLLTGEQEIQLARLIKDWHELRDKPDKTSLEAARCRRGQRAYRSFFNANIRLVVKIAGWYNRKSGSLAFEDLISEGMLGLHSAINKFEPSKGYKFSTYAVWWIRQSISRAIETKSAMIYLSGSAQQLARRAQRYIIDEELRTGTKPSLEAVAEHFRTTVENLRLYMAHRQTLVSLDAPVLNNGKKQDSHLVDLIEDPNSTLEIDEMSELQQLLPKLLADLSPTEQDIVLRRHLYGKPDTYSAISKDHGVSRERIRQVHERALRNMRIKLVSAGHDPELTPVPRCA